MRSAQGDKVAHSLCFGSFEIRPLERVLRAEGVEVAVGARALDVLIALAERRDRVVTKNELLELAWPGLTVEENNLSVQIHALRKILGHQAIITVPGRGYRLVVESDDDKPPGPAPTDRIVRRLAAIAFADVVEWTRLREHDAASALNAWAAVRAELIEPQVAAFGGRVIELTAEFVLVEFASAVDAVGWAVDLQQRLASRRSAGPMHAIRMRIGVCVEDAVVDADKLVGDGLHVASRISELAKADDIVITEPVRDFVWNKLPLRFKAIGLRQGVGLGRSVSVHLVLPLPGEAARAQPHLVWENRPTVAVLPFRGEGSDTDAYFGEGMTEEIITALSMNRALLVIARNSTLRYRDATPGIAEIAAELGVRYILTGAVRRAGDRLRINAELVDARAEANIWGKHFDGADKDIFTFQEEIATQISAAIGTPVQEAEMALVRDSPTESFSAYDCVLRGLSVQFNFNEADFALAGSMFQRAIDLDPHYAQAHAHLAGWYNLRIGEARTDAIGEDGVMAERLASRAIELDPRDAWALSMAGHIQSFLRKRYTTAMDMFDQALQLNPSCAAAWARSATTLAYMGRGEEALGRVRNAMRLSPFDQQNFSFCTTNGIASIVAGRYDDAVGWLGKARRLNPRYKASLRMLIAALALAGNRDEAHALTDEFLAVDPEFTVSRFGAWYPLQEPWLARVLEAMRAGGLPP